MSCYFQVAPHWPLKGQGFFHLCHLPVPSAHKSFRMCSPAQNPAFSPRNVVLQVASPVSCFLTHGLQAKIGNFWSCSALKNPQKEPQKSPVKAQTSWWLLHIFKAGLNILLESQALGEGIFFQTALSATSVTCCWLELGGPQGNTNTWKRKPNQHLTEQGHRELG